MNVFPFKRDIDELIDEFVVSDLTTFADMKKVTWLVLKSNLLIPSSEFISHLAEELGKFRDLIVEAKDKGVEIAAVVAKQMLDKNLFIFGAVEFNESSATQEINQLTELQNARVRFAYRKLTSDTQIEKFIHMDMMSTRYLAFQGNEVDLNSIHKMSIKYANAKKRAIKSAGEIMEVEGIKHISKEKELLGERVERLKEEWDLQRFEFDEQTKLNSLTMAQKRLKGNDENEDDELQCLLLQR